MTMQLLKVCLYGNNGERRDVDFVPSKVNIITGASKKGKSSLIDIVEYCLGSSECNVADGCIRETVAWYAIVLKFTDAEVFIARAAPLQDRHRHRPYRSAKAARRYRRPERRCRRS